MFEGKSQFFGQPSEWLLIPLAKALGEDKKEWYNDFRNGLQFQTPPTVDFLRFGFFLALGNAVNTGITSLFGGDLYWGWSTATCLSIPATLLALFRTKRPTKEEVAVEEGIIKDFTEFARKRLVRAQGKRCSETRIITAFRRSLVAYRTEEVRINELLTFVHHAYSNNIYVNFRCYIRIYRRGNCVRL